MRNMIREDTEQLPGSTNRQDWSHMILTPPLRPWKRTGLRFLKDQNICKLILQRILKIKTCALSVRWKYLQFRSSRAWRWPTDVQRECCEHDRYNTNNQSRTALLCKTFWSITLLQCAFKQQYSWSHTQVWLLHSLTHGIYHVQWPYQLWYEETYFLI